MISFSILHGFFKLCIVSCMKRIHVEGCFYVFYFIYLFFGFIFSTLLVFFCNLPFISPSIYSFVESEV